MNSVAEKVVADYANVSILDTDEMDVFLFWGLLRDAVVFNRAQTEEGRKWLHNAWRLTQTAPEDKKLRDKYGKGGS